MYCVSETILKPIFYTIKEIVSFHLIVYVTIPFNNLINEIYHLIFSEVRTEEPKQKLAIKSIKALNYEFTALTDIIRKLQKKNNRVNI